MRRSHRTRLLAALAVAAAVAVPASALASSHREAPLISSDPNADNTDVYAFVSPENDGTVTLIASYIPLEEPMGGPNYYKFGDDVLYTLYVDNNGDAVADIGYEFRFASTTQNGNTFLYNTGPISSLTDADWNVRQTYTVTRVDRAGSTVLGTGLATPPVNIGPNSTPDYAALAAQAVGTLSDGSKVFAGQRDDPFFVDLGVFDLLALRAPVGDHGGGVDGLGGFNCHAIALRVPRDRLTACGCTPGGASDANAVIGVWATASRQKIAVLRAPGEAAQTSGPFVQVSRLGMPLVNEAVIPIGKKDVWNGSQPSADGQFLSYVQNPELAVLLNAIYGVSVPPTPRADLVQVFLTGVPGLNQPANVVASEQLRLNVMIPAYPITSTMGVLGGDLGGYPNGRRLEDDVTDISLRAVAGVLVSGFNMFPNNALGDGVDVNDMPFLASFPYVATPHQGFVHEHHRTEPLRAPSSASGAKATPARDGGMATTGTSVPRFLLSHGPNPFGGTTTIRLALPASGPVQVSVFDVLGREVRSLANETLDAGDHALVWDGTDARGAKVSSGLYYYRVSANGRTEQRALMVQR